MADLAITNSFSAGTAIVASQMNTNFTDITTWANGAPNISASGSTTTIDGALTVSQATLLSDQTVSRGNFKDYGEVVNVHSTSGGTQTFDLTAGNVVTATVATSTTTFVFSDPAATGTSFSFTLILTNGGSQTVVLPTEVQWAGGTAPTLTASGRDILTFTTIDAGAATWYGFAAGLDMSVPS